MDKNNVDHGRRSRESALICSEPTLTQQHFKEESDINVIVDRAIRAGGLAPADRPAMFGDFTKIPSYQDAFDIVIKAQKAFMTLDWKVRERFNNDPQRLLAFLQDDKNRAEATSLGLLEPKKVDEVLDTLKSIDAGLKSKDSPAPNPGNTPGSDRPAQ